MNISRIILLLVGILFLLIGGAVWPYYNDPQYPVLRQISLGEGSVQRALADQMSHKRVNLPGRQIAERDDPGMALYKQLAPEAKKSRGVTIAAGKIAAEATGTRVQLGAMYSIRADHTHWQRILNDEGKHVELFEGDIICAEGTVGNTLLTSGGKMIEVGPGGIDVRDIEGFTKMDPRFPMLAFLGQVDDNVNKTFVINNPKAVPGGENCIVSRFSGKGFRILSNVPNKDEHNFMNPGVANHNGRGNFTVTRVEHKTQS